MSTLPPTPSSNGPKAKQSRCGNTPGKTALVGLLGGVATAATYAVYQRLPDEQRERLHRQVRVLAMAKWSELREALDF